MIGLGIIYLWVIKHVITWRIRMVNSLTTKKPIDKIKAEIIHLQEHETL
jgi:hypothetical protein